MNQLKKLFVLIALIIINNALNAQTEPFYTGPTWANSVCEELEDCNKITNGDFSEAFWSNPEVDEFGIPTNLHSFSTGGIFAWAGYSGTADICINSDPDFPQIANYSRMWADNQSSVNWSESISTCTDILADEIYILSIDYARVFPTPGTIDNVEEITIFVDLATEAIQDVQEFDNIVPEITTPLINIFESGLLPTAGSELIPSGNWQHQDNVFTTDIDMNRLLVYAVSNTPNSQQFFGVSNINITPIIYDDITTCNTSVTLEQCSNEILDIEGLTFSWTVTSGNGTIQAGTETTLTPTINNLIDVTDLLLTVSHNGQDFTTTVQISLVDTFASFSETVYACENSDIELSVPDVYDDLLWSTDEITNTINLTNLGNTDDFGIYTCLMTNSEEDCQILQTFYVRPNKINIDIDYGAIHTYGPEIGTPFVVCDPSHIAGRYLLTADPGYLDYNWTFSTNVTQVYGDNPNQVSFTTENDGDNETTVTITATTIDGCEVTNSVTVYSVDGTFEGGEIDFPLLSGTWNNKHYIFFTDLDISSGEVLVINNSLIEFAPGYGFNVTGSGTKLNINYSTLQYLYCADETWRGIKVTGNETAYPSSSYQPTVDVNESIIIGAEVAAESYKGGILKVNNSHFINNGVGVKYTGYLYNSTQSQSIINNSSFEINDDMYLTDLDPLIKSFVFIDKYPNLVINHTNMNDTRFYLQANERINGVLANNLTRIQIGHVNTNATLEPRFDNLNKAVVADNIRRVEVFGANFSNNLQGIHVSNDDIGTFIKGNHFDMGGIIDENSYGVFLNGCDAPEVTLNSFNNGARGLLISQGNGDYTIYKNNFHGFTFDPVGMYASAIVAQGDNTAGSQNSGLQFKCNYFKDNSKSIAVVDVAAVTGKVKQEQGYWLQSQPDIKEPANNVFINYCGYSTEDAFFVESNPGYIYNYTFHNFFTIMDFETCYTDAFMVKTLTNAPFDFIFEEACPDDPNASTGGGVGVIGFTSMSVQTQIIGGINTEIESKQENLDTKVDKGNTEILASEVYTTSIANYTEVAQKVSENDGYVSDLVLDEFITKDVGRPVAKTIALAQNSPLPETAKAKINQAGLPADLENYLKAQQNGISKREQKESEIAHLKSKKQYVFNRLIKAVLADSTLSKADSLLDLMDAQEDINIRKQSIKLLSAMGRKADALQKVSELRQDIVNLENMEQLDDLLQIEAISIDAKGKTEEEQTSLYQSNKGLLWSIYNKTDKASVKAYRLLKNMGEEIEAPLDVKLAFPKVDNNRTANANINSNFKTNSQSFKGLISLYPNPVKGRLTVEYLFEFLDEQNMNIYDINGRLLIQHQIQKAMGIETINVSKLPKGNYVLTINNTSQKFIVE